MKPSGSTIKFMELHGYQYDIATGKFIKPEDVANPLDSLFGDNNPFTDKFKPKENV